MNEFDVNDLKKLYVPSSSSHKGENGKLLIIGGSVLFHAASLWALQVASRIVDMVFYSSVPQNNELVEKEKEEFRNGIIVPRNKIDHYIEEADCILIGPGLPRENGVELGDDDTKELTERLFKAYPNKKWVVDGGSLQTIKPETIPHNAILTPHHGEFFKLFESRIKNQESRIEPDLIQKLAKEFNCTILLKGEVDLVSNGTETVQIAGGNEGMTKGGTGDVLAGLVAALYCKNEAFLSATSASFINKKAGETLAQKTGIYFNASDLATEIPAVMKYLLTP
ncbi:MAG TPA: NAD(P)H-hydrate dehydratase [Patescibacteria group bacterium]|jgi:NAD(P)H-hydrate epimerase|nr:NAD(P)H-hydrate dehydratase [Patescibacteria group bacterium]